MQAGTYPGVAVLKPGVRVLGGFDTEWQSGARTDVTLASPLGQTIATIAVTPGAVVFRNELLELIQYQPMSEKQYARPLLIVPPQINKFYIFDLSPSNSFVQYALKNGLQVFIISWRNPDVRHREWGLSSYVEATEEAMNVCRAITGAREVNLMGACAGGMTIAALQGHLQAKRQLRRVASASYLVSLLDSEIESQATLFIDEQTLEAAKRRSYQKGILEGRDMARVFAWMRPNEMVWNHWVNNVLMGRLHDAGTLRSLLAWYRPEDVEIAMQALERVGIVEKAYVRASNLSGGQQQRVGIARALAQQPKIILADEPVASLDPPTSHVVMRDLQRINRELNMTTIINLHFLDLAKVYGERIIGMRAGELVYDGTGLAVVTISGTGGATIQFSNGGSASLTSAQMQDLYDSGGDC